MTFGNPGEAWFGALSALLNLDADEDGTSPRGMRTVEHAGPAHLRIRRPQDVGILARGRRFRHVIGIVEGLSLVGQTSVPEVILDKVAAFRPFMRRSVFWGAYGPRVAGDVGQLVDLLKRDPDSRQAVLTIFDSDRDLGRVEQVDLPCTIALVYQVRRGALESWTVMRSNDAWLGLPYDLMQFGMLQEAVAQSLGLECGPSTHSAASLHLYERDVQKALEVTGEAIPIPFDGRLWGADDIGEISSRARRILVGQGGKVDSPTEFEEWCIDELDR
jgi:thymidylate synthase